MEVVITSNSTMDTPRNFQFAQRVDHVTNHEWTLSTVRAQGQSAAIVLQLQNGELYQQKISCGQNRHPPKSVEAAVPLSVGGAGSPSNTMSPELRPTSVPCGILIHLAFWPQYTSAKKWGAAVPLSGGWGPLDSLCNSIGITDTFNRKYQYRYRR